MKTSSESPKQIFQLPDIHISIRSKQCKASCSNNRNGLLLIRIQIYPTSKAPWIFPNLTDCHDAIKEVTNLKSNISRTSLESYRAPRMFPRQCHGSFILNSQRAFYLVVVQSILLVGVQLPALEQGNQFSRCITAALPISLSCRKETMASQFLSLFQPSNSGIAIRRYDICNC